MITDIRAHHFGGSRQQATQLKKRYRMRLDFGKNTFGRHITSVQRSGWYTIEGPLRQMSAVLLL